jgi:hypothetical protein
VILSVEEVHIILGHLKLFRYRVYLTTIYSCGLRLQEGTHLQVPDMDSARRLVHMRDGKGAKDRYVPLPQRTLELLRQYWTTTRHPIWLFPVSGRGGSAGPRHPPPCPETVSRTPFGLPSKRVASISGLPSTPCATAMPPIRWRLGCISASSRTIWGTTRRLRQPLYTHPPAPADARAREALAGLMGDL